MKLKVNYNIEAISVKDILLPSMVINKGQPFKLKDAYKENNAIVVGIKTNQGIEEAGFKIPVQTKIKSKKDVKLFIETFILPYCSENTSYTLYYVDK